jgi:hypothetical protein
MYWRQSDVLAQQQHYRDLLHEAEQARLAALAIRPEARHGFRLYVESRVLLSLGRHLSDWGCRLQTHYGMAECLESYAEFSASRTR